MVGQALQIEAGLLAYCLAVPVVAIVRMCPLSLNGIGVSEGSFVFLIGNLGVPSGKAMALALVMLGLLTAMALTGSLVFAWQVARLTWNHGRHSSFNTPNEVAHPKAPDLLNRRLGIGEIWFDRCPCPCYNRRLSPCDVSCLR